MVNIVKTVKKRGFRDTFNAFKRRAANIPDQIFMPIRLKKLVKNYETKLAQNLDIKEIREKTLDYTESMQIKNTAYGQYRYSKSQKKPVLYASIYAVLIRHLYKDLDSLTEKQRREWIDYIQSFQDNDGLFKDPAVENEIANNTDWWGWRHLTLHAIMALTALNSVTKKKFKILEPFKNTRYAIKWLETRNWQSDPAGVSNEIQNYCTLLQYMRDFQGEDWADKTIYTMLDWLDEHQAPQTGLWGNHLDTPIFLSKGVQTGYHLWLLYFYDKRPIKFIKRIIDSCLATQNELGGFGVPVNSSACEDIDSIDPLVRLSFITDYRKEEIYLALQKVVLWILINMNEDGGFVFRRMEPFVYGHQLMSSAKDESAMFPTWFRTLSLAYISKVLPDSVVGKFYWQFLKCPGLQFWQD